MAVSSPGDMLPCSIPQADAEKLRAIGVKGPKPGVGGVAAPASAAAANDDGNPALKALAAEGRTLPVPANPTSGTQLDLHV